MGYVSSIINVRHRLTQIVVLVVLILGSMLYAEVANAQGLDRPKYRIKVHKNANKTCYILHKKRTAKPKDHPMIASARRSKTRALAETDGLASSD